MAKQNFQHSYDQNHSHKENIKNTFQIQVLGSHGSLCGDFGVYFDSVKVVCISWDHHIVPVIVIQRCVGISFDEMSSISQIWHIMEISACKQSWKKLVKELLHGLRIQIKCGTLKMNESHPFTSSTTMKSLPSPRLYRMSPSGEVVLNWKNKCME